MNFPLMQTYRLAPRGRGLACDKAGVALGPADLVCVDFDATGRRRCETAPLQEVGRILSAAYGPQPENIVHRLHRGLRRVASAIEADDLCLAGIESVLLGLPDLAPSALAKLAEIAELEKWGTAWRGQPRVPEGQSGGGQWTTEGGAGGAPAVDAKPAAHASVQPAASGQKPKLPLDDGVYRPQTDASHITLTAGGEEDEAESRRSNGPPDDFTRLEDIFPGLKDHPGLGIPLAPIDGFLQNSVGADEANLEPTMGQYWALMRDIRRVDPSFRDPELLAPGSIAGLSWQGRTNLINDLRMQRAVAYYKIRGDAGPLQVETLRFLQEAVDAAYAQAVSAADAGRLQPRLSREEAIGNSVDFAVRKQLRYVFNTNSIPFGPNKNITINNRDYETTEDDSSYRIPDARIGDITFDWTLTAKTMSTPQIRGFFRADSQPRAVIIVRPSQFGQDSSYLIPRPAYVPL